MKDPNTECFNTNDAEK